MHWLLETLFSTLTEMAASEHRAVALVPWVLVHALVGSLVALVAAMVAVPLTLDDGVVRWVALGAFACYVAIVLAWGRRRAAR